MQTTIPNISQNGIAQNIVPNMSQNGYPTYSYPNRRNTTSTMPEKDDKIEHILVDGVMQSKPQFTSIGVGRKVAAASTGPSQDY